MEAKVVGHIDHVLKGEVPPELRERWIDASSLKYAFEIGSPEGIESLGETIVLGGIAYTQSTATGRLIHGERLVTTGLFIIPKGAKPADVVRGAGPLSAGELYERLQQKVGGPYAYVGLLAFEQLEATAITRPPIHGEPIFDHEESYYAKPPISEKGGYAAIMGVAAPSPLNAGLKSVLYENPFERAAPINAHTHILTIKNLIDDIADVSPEMAVRVLHLFPQAIVSSYALELYPVTGIVDF